LIFDAAGGRCLQHGHPLQRAWRDVGAINHHISLNFDAVMSMYGQFVFELPLEDNTKCATEWPARADVVIE
jgi:resorcinol 4-hydroxylase (FADH2)